MRVPPTVIIELLVGATALAGCGTETNDGSGHAGVGEDAGASEDAGSREDAGIAPCGILGLSSAFRLGPAAPGQRYLRCDTLGPEAAWQVTLSPDARHIAARTAAGTVRLLATDPWREVAQIASPLGRIDAAAFSPDGAWLALLSAEMGQVTLWTAEDGMLARAFAGPPASTIDAIASALAFSSDGRRLATSLGTLIDITTGVVADWRTGMAVLDSGLTVNPENLGLGEAIPGLAFSAGDSLLFVDTEYRVGNSPPSTRLSLRAPATGQAAVLFDGYSRALAGFALSPDGRFVALAKTAEAEIAGFARGLAVYRADTGALVATDPRFVGTVLGLSRDGQRLFTLVGSTVGVLATADLHPLGEFAWPAGVRVVGIAPGDELVGSGDGRTSWWDSSTGSIVRTVNHPLDQVTWSGDGRFAAGTGDPSALFYLWRESDATELCAPPPRGAPVPAMASLGTTLDVNGTATSADGSIVVTQEMGLHTHATDWTALHVRAAPGGALLRLFGATPLGRPVAIAAPSGARLYTPEGPNLAVWCH